MRLRPALPTDVAAVAALHADSWRRFYRGSYADHYLDGDLLTDRLAVWSARLAHPDRRHVTIVADAAETPAGEPDAGGIAAGGPDAGGTAAGGPDAGGTAVGVTPAAETTAGAHPVGAAGAPPRTGAVEQSGTRQDGVARPLAGFVHLVVDHDERWGSLVDNLHVVRGRQRAGLGSALIHRAARAAAERGTTPALYLWVQERNAAAQAFYAAHGGQVVERAACSDPGGVPGRLHGRPMKLRVVWPDARTLAVARRG